MKTGIIGFGRFGKLVVSYLSKDFYVLVYSRSKKEEEIREAGGMPTSLEEVCKCNVVIPCVPISAFKATLQKIKPFLKENSLLIDVCSVKEKPVELMKATLLKNTQILATHPMFGPDSTKEGLKGNKVVMCNINAEKDRYEKVKKYLESKGLVIIETTPEHHDKEIAKSLVLTHFIGRSLLEMGAGSMEIDTEGYKKLLSILETVEHDTLQLFKDMNHYNPYAKKVREEFIKSAQKVSGEVEK